MAPKPFSTVALTPLIFGLKNAAAVLRKAEAHAQTNTINATEYLTARLYPDMGDLCYQVQHFTQAAVDIVVRSNPAAPTLPFVDEEKTFSELLARVQKTLEYLESIDPAVLDGREDEAIVLLLGKQMPKGPLEVRFTAFEYVLHQGHPNFWFHVTTMYGIFRHKGVPLGKMDFSNGAGLISVKWLGADA